MRRYRWNIAKKFSNNTDFLEKLDELIYRIYGQPRYPVEPFGDILDFKIIDLLRKSERENKAAQLKITSKSNEFDLAIPNLKRITERDIDKFLKENFVEITNLLALLFEQVKEKNIEFEFDKDDVYSNKILYKLYVEGKNRYNKDMVWRNV